MLDEKNGTVRASRSAEPVSAQPKTARKVALCAPVQPFDASITQDFKLTPLSIEPENPDLRDNKIPAFVKPPGAVLQFQEFIDGRFTDMRTVDEHWARADPGDHVRCRRKRVRRDDHLVSWPDPEREHGEMQRCGPGRDGERMLDSAGLGEARLELGDLRAHRQLPALEHLRHRVQLCLAEVRPGEPHAIAGVRSLYQAIVRARPSSRSTFASKPSTSRAFSTFGMRSSTSA